MKRTEGLRLRVSALRAMHLVFAVSALLFADLALVLDAASASAESRSLTSRRVPVAENFDGLVSSGSSNVLPGGFAIQETQIGTSSTSKADGFYTAGTGSALSGDTYSFGSGPDRALGNLRSSNFYSVFGASFTNDTGAAIKSLTISYTGEEWRLGAAGRGPDRLDFSYATDAASLTSGTYKDVDALDFSTPNTVGTGAKNGNDSVNRTNLSQTITGLNIPAGAKFFIRWSDADPGGPNDGLAVDDFSMIANGPPAANDDPGYAVNEDEALRAPADGGVLANDTDPDGDVLQAAREAGPDHGDLALFGDGSFVYTPSADFNGADGFVYRASDGQALSGGAAAGISVRPVNDAPGFAKGPDQSASEDAGAQRVAGWATDIFRGPADESGQTLDFVVSVPEGEKNLFAEGGRPAVSADGALTYTPAPDANGTAAVGVSLKDGGGTANGGDDESDRQTFNISVESVNDAPRANDDSAATDEDAAVLLDVLANDAAGPENERDQVLGVVPNSLSSPAHGEVSPIQSGPDAGKVLYTPDADYNGPDEFTYEVGDGQPENGASLQPAKVALTVKPVNDDPKAKDDSYDVNSDRTLAVEAPGLLANDTDADGDNLTVADGDESTDGVQPVEAPRKGSLKLESDGSFVYRPDASGADGFTYRVSDGHGGVATAAAAINVTAANAAPEARDDAYNLDEGETLAVNAASGVLTNDAKADGETLRAEQITGEGKGPDHGRVDLAPDGSFTYTPTDKDFNGTDRFTYRADSQKATNNLSGEGTVTLSVRPVDDVPTAADDGASTEEDRPAAVNVLANDADPDGDSLAVGDFDAASEKGGVISEGPDGTLRYTPAKDSNGTDSFRYSASDGNLQSAPATVTVEVSPVADNPLAAEDFATTDEDGSVSVDVLANDRDPDGGDLAVRIVKAPEKGRAVVSGENRVVYTPDKNANGPDGFEYRACTPDGRCAGPAPVNVEVSAVNDPPTARDASVSTEEDRTYNLDVFGGDSPLAEDVEVRRGEPGAALIISGATDGRHGKVTVGEDGGISYVPDGDYNGPDSFSYAVRDEVGAGASGTVSLDVTPVGDDPAGRPDAATTDEDVPVNINVLANDTDPDGDALSIKSFTQPDGGAVTRGPDGTLTFTPNADFNGETTFSYTLWDGAAGSETTVKVTVSATNDAPRASGDSYSTDEDTPLAADGANGGPAGVLANDTDPDGSADLSAVEVAGPEHGTLDFRKDGTFVYAPNGDYNGPDGFVYRASDGEKSSEEVRVELSVRAVNDRPVARDDDLATPEDEPLYFPASRLVENDAPGPDTALDESGQSLFVDEIGPVRHGEVSLADGEVSFVPEKGYNGPAGFSYTVCDSADPRLCSERPAAANVNVTAVNSAPTAKDAGATVAEDGENAAFDLADLVGDAETSDAGMGYEIVRPPTPAEGQAALSGSKLVFDPADDYNGTVEILYRATDAGDGEAAAKSASGTLTVAVTPVNDAPVAKDDARTATAGEPLVFPASDLAANDSAGPEDESGQVLSVTAVGGATGGAVGLKDREVTFTPDAGFDGPGSFTYTVADGQGGAATGTVSVAVNPRVNRSPVAADDFAAAEEDTPAVVDVLANDADPDGDVLSVAVVGVPANGSATVLADGSIRYVPKGNFAGADEFTYRVSDGRGASATAKVAVSVAPVNDSPLARADAFRTKVNRPINLNVLANDTDADGDALSVGSFGRPSSGSVVRGAGGTLRFVPKRNFTGRVSFSYRATDGKASSPAATVTVRVTRR